MEQRCLRVIMFSAGASSCMASLQTAPSQFSRVRKHICFNYPPVKKLWPQLKWFPVWSLIFRCRWRRKGGGESYGWDGEMDEKKTWRRGRNLLSCPLNPNPPLLLFYPPLASFPLFSPRLSLFKCPFFFSPLSSSLTLTASSFLPSLQASFSLLLFTSCSPPPPHQQPPYSSLPLLPFQPLLLTSPPPYIRLCVPCHSPCCPRLRHMALSSLLLSSINTVVGGNYRHIAQHARLCSGLWCWRQNKAGENVRCLKRARKEIWYSAFQTLPQTRNVLENPMVKD